jgi:hypothetical protein
MPVSSTDCDCDCGCDPIEVPLEAASTSLLYIGEFPLAIIARPVHLPDALQQIFLPALQLPTAA